MGIYGSKSDNLMIFWRNYFAQNWLVLAEVWIWTPQRNGAGPFLEALYLCRKHFLTINWYFAEDTLFWPKIDAPVTKHCHLPYNVTLEVPIWYFNLLFTHFYALFNKNSMLIPSFRYMLTHRLHINQQKCWLDRPM